MLDPSSVKFTDATVTGNFLIQRGLMIEPVAFECKNNLETSDVSIECQYPHTEFAIRDHDGIIISNGKVGLLMTQTSSKFNQCLDLEVLYIGQAYGDKGSRTADVRLANHGTLQGIYAEAIRNSPDQEIWMVLCSFDLQVIASIDGRSKAANTTASEADAHIEEVFANRISEQQQINFTEAALIRYFQPKYNVIYKDSFPNPAHATYSHCYDIDLNSVIVEINTEEIFTRLYSSVVPTEWSHFAQFTLHNAGERKEMFNLFD